MSLKGTVSGTQRLNGNVIPRGNDGISPTIDIAPIEGGTRVTITDINGTKQFDVLGSISKEQIEELIREHLENNLPDFNESDPTVPAWAKQPTKPKYTAEEVGALSADSLQPAINAALAQAKASGEFKGDPGDDYVLTEADKNEIAEIAAEMVEVPEGGTATMQPLTFTGAVNATYDGSKAVSVEIPEGGGGGTAEWRKVAEIKTTEDLTYLSATEDMDGNPFAFDEMFVLVGAARASDATTGGQLVISLCPEWHSSFNAHGIYGFNIAGDVYAFSAMFKVLTDGLLRMEYSATKRIAGNLSQYTGFASNMEKFNMQYSSNAQSYSGQMITPSRGGSDAKSYLNENGKIRSVTIGTDMATSIKIGAGSTLEVWGR